MEKALLDLEEVHMSGEAPANELYAPLQGGRDFVTERLLIDYRKIELIRDQIVERAAAVRKRADAGLVPQKEIEEQDRQVDRVNGELDEIERRIDLRKGYLSGDLSAREISLRQMMENARSRLAGAERVLQIAESQYNEMSKLHADGLIPDRDLRDAEYAIIEARSECRIAEIELELLEERLEE